MMGTGGLLNFHLSVGSYLEYYPGWADGNRPSSCIHIHIYSFLLNLTWRPNFSKTMNDKHAEKKLLSLVIPTDSRDYKMSLNCEEVDAN